MFQNTAVPSPLAAKPESNREKLKAGSRASSLRSAAASARSIRSSTRASMRDTYEARTWRNRLRRNSVRYPLSISKTSQLTSNRGLQGHLSQALVVLHASPKKHPCGAKDHSDHIPSATYAVFFSPSVNPEAGLFMCKETLTESLTSSKQTWLP